MKETTILQKSDVYKFENQIDGQDVTGGKPRKDRKNDGQWPCIKKDNK